MKCTLEKVASNPDTYVARLHVDSNAVIGYPYFSALTVCVSIEKVATLYGFCMEHFTATAMAAIRDALLEIGVQWVTYTRIKPGCNPRTILRQIA